jgi:hypothetical protein
VRIGVWPWLLSLAAAGAAAQVSTPELAPSRALQCLTPAAADRGSPEYPPESYARKEGGEVDVELTFRAPDEGPSVRIQSSTNRDKHALEDAVHAFVARLRVPCLAEIGPSVTLRQTYVFRPNDGRKVMWSAPRDTADARRAQLIRCIRHLDPNATVGYPDRARREEIEGNVLLTLRFTGQDSPPRVTVLAQPKQSVFNVPAVDHAEGLRMPCHEGLPLDVDYVFIFRMEGGTRIVIQDISLLTLLRSTTNAAKSRVYFDLATMGCPFDVRIHYLQPHRPNGVGEVGTTHPARLPFLDWLSRLELKLPRDHANRVLGQDFTVSVPCGTVDL